MANPPKAKGTAAENAVVRLLHDCGLRGAHRTAAGTQSHDITGVGDWIIEVKHRKRWDIPAYVRKIRAVAARDSWTDDPWVIFVSAGDRRTTDGRETGRIAVMDADMAAELIAHWERETAKPRMVTVQGFDTWENNDDAVE